MLTICFDVIFMAHVANTHAGTHPPTHTHPTQKKTPTLTHTTSTHTHTPHRHTHHTQSVKRKRRVISAWNAADPHRHYCQLIFVDNDLARRHASPFRKRHHCLPTLVSAGQDDRTERENARSRTHAHTFSPSRLGPAELSNGCGCLCCGINRREKTKKTI
jgi:hypothetical protein